MAFYTQMRGLAALGGEAPWSVWQPPDEPAFIMPSTSSMSDFGGDRAEPRVIGDGGQEGAAGVLRLSVFYLAFVSAEDRDMLDGATKRGGRRMSQQEAA